MTDRARLAKNTSYLTIAYIIQKVITLLYSILITRAYLPAGQGMYATSLAVTALFAVFIDLGFASIVTRETARNPEKASLFLSQALLFRLMMGIGVYAMMLGYTYVVNYPPLLRELVMIAGLATILDMLSTSCWGTFRGLHILKYESISVVIVTAIMAGIGSAAALTHAPLQILVGSILLSSIFNITYSLIMLARRAGVKITWRLDWKVFKFLAVLSIPFAVAAVFSRVYTNLDTLLLERLLGARGAEFAGLYSTPNKIILALEFIPAALSAAIYPAMSSYFVTARDQVGALYARATHYLLLMVFPASIGLFILADKLIPQLYGTPYLPSILPLQILTIALFAAFLMFPQGSLLAATNRQKQNSVILGCGMLINAVGNFILIPRYQAIGAAIASAATYSFIFIVSLIYTYHDWKAHTKFLIMTFFRIGAAALGMGFGVWALKEYLPVAILIPAAAILYAGLLFTFKGIAIDDIGRIVGIITKKEQKSEEVAPIESV